MAKRSKSNSQTWKEFDETDKKEIQPGVVTVPKPETPGLIKDKPLNVIGKTLRIVEIVTGVFFFITSLITLINQNLKFATLPLAIVCIVLSSITLVLLITLIIMVLVKKSWGPLYTNAYIGSLIMILLAFGMSIALYYLIAKVGSSPMGIVVGIMIGICNLMLSKVHSFKKTAK